MSRQDVKNPIPNHTIPSNREIPKQDSFRTTRMWNFLVIALTVALVAITLEYIGVINAIPKFGQRQPYSLNLRLWKPSSFPDIADNFWSDSFIKELAQQEIIIGYPNGEFRPTQPITRGEFAAMVHSAFPQNSTPSGIRFKDVPDDYWGISAIRNETKRGFFAGYPGGEFRPDQEMTKVDALVALVNGLKLKTDAPVPQVLSSYQDAQQIPEYGKTSIAAATQAGIIVNYPQKSWLRPRQSITRAEAATLIYQGLVYQEKVNPIPSEFIVSQ